MRYEYIAPRIVRYACWCKYELKEMNELKGVGSSFDRAGMLMKWWQNTLLDMTNSYNVSSVAVEGPGLKTVSD